MIIKKPLTVTVILLFISVSVIPSTSTTVEESSTVSFDSKTHYVGGNGTGNYTKIQDAIDNASDGDTVFVYNDSSPYYENIVVDKSINLIGEGRDTTVIDGVGEGEVVGLNGLAYHPTTDKLYGASSYSFYEIDMDSGLQTYIGDFNTGGLMIAISFDNTGDCYGVDIGTDSLYSIDIGTGEASLIDSLGINLNYAQDCAYDRDNDIFYLSAYSVEADDRGVDDDRAPGELISRNGGELYICDTGTANLTLVGTFENGAEITGFAIPYTQGEELDRRFGLNMLTNEINYRGLSYEPFYGYCAYVPGGQMTDYTIYFNSDSPENLTTIAYTQSDDFIAGGTWANTTWYGVEYSTGRLYTIGPDTGDMDAIGDVVTVSADWVNLSGFTITNSGYYPFDGIDVRSNFNTINDSTIMNNRNGIILHCSSNNTLIGNNISNNSYGIKSYSSSNNTLIGNNISNNGHWYYRGGGIYLGYSSSNAITDNNISSNNRDGIHLDWYSSNNAITDNNISSNNRDGIHLYDSHSNTITGNNISSNNHNGIYIYGSADDNTINGNTISNNWNGIYLDWYSSSNTIT
ncbi:MAG: right-handed parallel beta-helix repeat-containing protein, partial [Thermoplasmatales archaeon]